MFLSATCSAAVVVCCGLRQGGKQCKDLFWKEEENREWTCCQLCSSCKVSMLTDKSTYATAALELMMPISHIAHWVVVLCIWCHVGIPSNTGLEHGQFEKEGQKQKEEQSQGNDVRGGCAACGRANRPSPLKRHPEPPLWESRRNCY